MPKDIDSSEKKLQKEAEKSRKKELAAKRKAAIAEAKKKIATRKKQNKILAADAKKRAKSMDAKFKAYMADLAKRKPEEYKKLIELGKIEKKQNAAMQKSNAALEKVEFEQMKYDGLIKQGLMTPKEQARYDQLKATRKELDENAYRIQHGFIRQLNRDARAGRVPAEYAVMRESQISTGDFTYRATLSQEEQRKSGINSMGDVVRDAEAGKSAPKTKASETPEVKAEKASKKKVDFAKEGVTFKREATKTAPTTITKEKTIDEKLK